MRLVMLRWRLLMDIIEKGRFSILFAAFSIMKDSETCQMIKSLTSLRGIFILFIFFHHCMDFYVGGGTMGVAFFFVLSGYCLTLGYINRVIQPTFSYKQYLMRRFVRFYPLHWLCLLFALTLSIVTCKFGLKDIPIFIFNAMLLQTVILSEEFFFSFNAVSWYLANTLIFCIVFPYLLKIILRSKTIVNLTLFVTLILLYVGLLIILPGKSYHSILYISPFVRIDDFIYGIVLALAYLKLKEMPNVRGLVKKFGTIIPYFLLVIIVLLVIESLLLSKRIIMIAPVYWPLLGMLIIVTSLSELDQDGRQSWLRNKYLIRLGEISFPVFLIHQLVLRCFTNLFMFINIPQNIYYVLFTLIITIGLSWLLDKYVLNRITQWLTKKIQPSITILS